MLAVSWPVVALGGANAGVYGLLVLGWLWHGSITRHDRGQDR